MQRWHERHCTDIGLQCLNIMERVNITLDDMKTDGRSWQQKSSPSLPPLLSVSLSVTTSFVLWTKFMLDL